MRHLARSMRSLAMVAALLLAAGCRESTAPSSDLVDARRRWLLNGPASYEFTYGASCFCGQEFLRPWVIRVAAGQVTSVRFADTGAEVSASAAAFAPTIDRLFDDIAGAVQRGAQVVDVTYDPQYGYPVRGAIDGSAQVADDEYWFSVAGFHAL